jgi:hypothetical protein
VLGAALAVAILSTFVRFVSAHGWFEYDARDVVLCDTLRASTQAGDRLLIVGDNNPMWLFCSERKGWALSADESTDARIAEALQRGAAVAILINPAERPSARQLLSSGRRLIHSDGRLEVYSNR